MWKIYKRENLKIAVKHGFDKTMKLREAAGVFGYSKSTLAFRIKMLRNNRKSKSDNFSTKYSVNQVFTNAGEAMLENYMLKSIKNKLWFNFLPS